MPHFEIDPIEVDKAPYGAAFYPIVGNTEHAGICSNGAGEALFATYASGEFQCFTTTDGYAALISTDNSVSYLSTIVGNSFSRPRNIALTRISGVVYATIVGGNTSTSKWGHWVYKDTSTGSTGAGPWVLHGTISSTSRTGDLSDVTNRKGGGEILVFDNGNWSVASFRCDTAGREYYGMCTSTDAGVTWGGYQQENYDNPIGINEYSFHRGPGSFGKDSIDRWWATWGGNEANSKNAYSTDGTWYDGGSLGNAGPEAPHHGFSMGDRIYRLENKESTGNFLDRDLQYTTSALSSGSAWTTVFDMFYIPYQATQRSVGVCANISDSDEAPVIAVVDRGRVLGLIARIGGWTVGRIGMG